MGLTRDQQRRARARAREHRRAGELLPIEALTHDGLLIRSDGAFVRYLEVVPSNPLVLDPDGCARMTRGFTELLTRLPAGFSVQCYAQATPVSLDDLLARGRAETDAATEPLLRSDEPLKRAQGEALRRLAACTEDSLRVHAEDQAAVDVRYVLVVPWDPAALGVGERHRVRPRRRGGAPLQRPLAEHLRIARESLQHADRLRSALSGLDMTASLMTGPEIADLLWTRFSPAAAALKARKPSAEEPPVAAPLDNEADVERARTAAVRLRDAICQGELDLLDRHRLGVDGGLEHTIYVSRRPSGPSTAGCCTRCRATSHGRSRCTSTCATARRSATGTTAEPAGSGASTKAPPTAARGRTARSTSSRPSSRSSSRSSAPVPRRCVTSRSTRPSAGRGRARTPPRCAMRSSPPRVISAASSTRRCRSARRCSPTCGRRASRSGSTPRDAPTR